MTPNVVKCYVINNEASKGTCQPTWCLRLLFNSFLTFQLLDQSNIQTFKHFNTPIFFTFLILTVENIHFVEMNTLVCFAMLLAVVSVSGQGFFDNRRNAAEDTADIDLTGVQPSGGSISLTAVDAAGTAGETETEATPEATSVDANLAACPKTPDALLLVKQCRFFSEIMGVQPKTSATVYPPRSLIVAVTVFCKVPDAKKTFVDCVDETFRATTCSQPTKTQLNALSGEYWKRYCVSKYLKKTAFK